jgi:hypothetical protein
MDIYLTIRKNAYGAWAIAINGYYNERYYYGYSRKEALTRYRAENGLRYKHIPVFNR